LEDLTKYRNQFQSEFPKYSSQRYAAIVQLFEAFDDPDACTVIASSAFENFLRFVKPIVAVKDFKSQSSFPESKLSLVIEKAAELRNLDKRLKCDHKNFEKIFQELVSSTKQGKTESSKSAKKSVRTGFDFATGSALFHFCMPDKFPIVDMYVKEACKYLNDKYAREIGCHYPEFPSAKASAAHKWKCYKDYIQFLESIRVTQNRRGTRGGEKWKLRDLDCALMVLGKRKSAKNKSKGTSVSKKKALTTKNAKSRKRVNARRSTGA